MTKLLFFFICSRLPSEPSANRYMMSFVCEDPFVIDGIEFVTLKVKGKNLQWNPFAKVIYTEDAHADI